MTEKSLMPIIQVVKSYKNRVRSFFFPQEYCTYYSALFMSVAFRSVRAGLKEAYRRIPSYPILSTPLHYTTLQVIVVVVTVVIVVVVIDCTVLYCPLQKKVVPVQSTPFPSNPSKFVYDTYPTHPSILHCM